MELKRDANGDNAVRTREGFGSLWGGWRGGDRKIIEGDNEKGAT